MKKAQASLDFLMTYGWALLLIVLVVGALFALGIFDVGTFVGSRATGFPQVGVVAWKLDANSTFTSKFRNQAGTNINITQINATLGTSTVTYNTTFSLSTGKTSDIITIGNLPNVGSKGSSYSMSLIIVYTDVGTNFTYEDAGTVTGKVS